MKKMLLKFRIPHQVQIDFLKRDYSIGQVSFFVLEFIGKAQPLQTTDGFSKPQMLVNRNFNQHLCRILMVTSIITTPLMMPSPIGHFHLPLVEAQMFCKRWKRLHWRALMRAIILSMEELKNTNEFFWLWLCFARLRIAILTAMDKWTSLKSVSFSCSFFICSKGEKGFLFNIHPAHK